MKMRILTDFNSYIRRNRKRFLVRQDPKVIWLTGLSGAGKTTIAVALEKEIQRKGYFTKTFDGDIIRNGINKDLGFSDADRMENIRRTAEIARLFVDHGLVVICSFISPQKAMRDLAREIIGKEKFIEVFVDCPLAVCEQRDVKGLYKKARAGMIKDFTGIGSLYENPEHADIVLRTDLWTIKKTAKYLMRKILPQIRYQKRKWLTII
ncbi:MAG: adenylyl-sulfate kinase [Bacteroidota bacterium]